MSDARSLASNEQQKLRRRAARLRRKGKSLKAVAAELGVHPGTVSRWCAAYEREGFGAIRAKTRGPGKRLKRQVTPYREMKMIETLAEQLPSNFHLPEKLWTTDTVLGMIRRKFKLQFPHRTTYEYLKRWKIAGDNLRDVFTSQTPKPAEDRFEEVLENANHWAKRNNKTTYYYYDRILYEADDIRSESERLPRQAEVCRLLGRVYKHCFLGPKRKLHFYLTYRSELDMEGLEAIQNFLYFTSEATNSDLLIVTLTDTLLTNEYFQQWQLKQGSKIDVHQVSAFLNSQ